MLTKPPIADSAVVTLVRENYSIAGTTVTFLPLGADIDAAVYRVATDDGRAYFLKLKRGGFDPVGVEVPAFLYAEGITAVVAPLTTTSGSLFVRAHDFDWMLYPFVEGTDGWNVPLSPAQWRSLGTALRAIHATHLPAPLAERIPRETFGAQFRDIVRSYARDVAHNTFDDPIAARFAAFWRDHDAPIALLVERAETLAREVQSHAAPFVLCHTDLHAGNVLLGDDTITIVDWDAPVFAPKERDLMFVGGGIGRYWKRAEDAAFFYDGYDTTDVDWTALSYYRYERIVADIVAYADQLFGVVGSEEDRAEGFAQVTGQFGPDDVIAIAHRTYERL